MEERMPTMCWGRLNAACFVWLAALLVALDII